MKDSELRAAPRNPTIPEVRLHCLDLAVRGALLTGRANDFMQQAEQYFGWVMTPVAKIASAAKPLELHELLAQVPRKYLRTVKELKAAGVERPAAPPAGEDGDEDEQGDQGDQGNQGNQGDQGGGDRVPASLRQAGG